MKPKLNAINFNIPISKIDEEKRMVWGFATVEELDKHGEVIGYDASKKAFADWPGNIREMHQDVAVGKAFETNFDDKQKAVAIGVRVSESADGENAWIKVKEGVLSGFSIGGKINDFEYRKMQVNGEQKDVLVVTDYVLGEVSLVDNPACPSATFQVVKSAAGKLVHEEKMETNLRRSAKWFERRYRYSPNQSFVIKLNDNSYNKSSMDKKTDAVIEKNIYSAAYLACLGRELAWFIADMRWMGKESEELISALGTIKEAIAVELKENETWPDVVISAAEKAMSAMNITKQDVEELMDKNEIEKGNIAGSVDRDRHGNDPVEPEIAEAPAEEVAEETKADDEIPAEETKTDDTPADDAETTDEPEGDDDSDDKKPKKSTGADDIQKTNTNEPTDLEKALSAVGELTKTVETLTKEVAGLKEQPMPSKSQAGFVEKSDGGENPMDEKETELKELLAKADEYAADPYKGSLQDRAKLAKKIRIAQRGMDPRSVAQHNAIKATFPAQTVEK